MPVSAPATPPRPETPPVERRQRYLEVLPRAIARGLTPEGRIHPHIDKPVDVPAEVQYLKSLEDWMPITILLRYQIEPDCDPAKRDEPWIFGYYASIFFRHERLDDVKTKLGWETIPVTQKWREVAWLQIGIEQHIAIDHNWGRAPSEIQDNCGVPVYRYTGPKGTPLASVLWGDVSKDSRRKWDELPDDQCVFVKLSDFVEETTPPRSPHLRNLIVRLDPKHIPGVKRDEFAMLQNGVNVPPLRGDVLPFHFWRTKYAEFAERWVRRGESVEWVTDDV